MPVDVRAAIRSEVARTMFTAEFGRAPADARELSGQVAKLSKPRTTAVAGFDLTFSPVKSVSALWALAEPPVAAVIERAHHAAVADALAYIEREALFTRLGAGGVRQVDVRGLVATAFTHRDSRAGDPDLHTHVAVANKVQTLDGRWLAIDARPLYKAVVAASETYNTSLEARLAAELGLSFTERYTDAGKRPVREIAGMDQSLLTRWSARRANISRRAGELARAFQDEHRRPPTPIEKIALAQQATLETREGKHPARTLEEQRRTWRAEAEQVLGGRFAVQRMVQQVFRQQNQAPEALDDRWYSRTAQQIIATVEAGRATWQVWHVRAEALRRVRAALVPPQLVEQAVTRLVAVSLGDHSVPLTTPADPVNEPAVLRRRDGASMYTTAGSALFTSPAVLAAEQRLVAIAGRVDARCAPTEAVELALLACAAEGIDLNEGQRHLVKEMATSGRRLQLAIAPAGSGKTTAMRALTAAWQESGGTVIGLAPSAAAADALGQQVAASTDTLAKLTWGLTHPDSRPDWLGSVGPDTLFIIDEAGMADTLSLDTVVGFAVSRDATVRLIGDDQQLAAIGAGGVLRDIASRYGAVQLNELVRFADPGEAAASIALREGRPEALGFYLDNQRVHVGDQAASLDQLFTAWLADTRVGRDAIMLAPTRDLVADLNRRARDQRLATAAQPSRQVQLADGNLASAGDVVITRINKRAFRVGPTDWVKNGDRWTVESVRRDGSLQVRHLRHRRAVVLPADYVTDHVELGYATTIHSAQGVSVDTAHGLAAGAESRQQLYTMLTRGRNANHVYVQLVDDGDPHSLIKPATIAPPSATEILEQILATDEAPVSAATEQRRALEPATQLGVATARYTDALGVAAEHVCRDELAELDQTLSTSMPWLATADSWPALRTQLALLTARGKDPLLALSRAAADAPLDEAGDPAAVLTWRIDHTNPNGRGPLPWLSSIPDRLAAHPDWGPYLTARGRHVHQLGEAVERQVRAASDRPAWAADLPQPNGDTITAIEVWRAANQVDPADLRPTGPRPTTAAGERHQRVLNKLLRNDTDPALAEWTPMLDQIAPRLVGDPDAPTLARRLSQLSAAGLPAHALLREAAGAGPLPDDHAAAALWWRISGKVNPGFIATLDHSTTASDWDSTIEATIGHGATEELRTSPWWPALLSAIDHAVRRGWPLEKLLTQPAPGSDDPCQALVWRTTLLTSEIPLDDVPPDPADEPHEEEPPAFEPVDDEAIAVGLGLEALIRNNPEPLPATALQIKEQLAHADAWRESGTTPERLTWINEQAARYYSERFTDSWARPYLAGRLGTDPAATAVQPGYAPAGWTSLVTHLHRQGVTDDELVIAGLARPASTGRLHRPVPRPTRPAHLPQRSDHRVHRPRQPGPATGAVRTEVREHPHHPAVPQGRSAVSTAPAHQPGSRARPDRRAARRDRRHARHRRPLHRVRAAWHSAHRDPGRTTQPGLTRTDRLHRQRHRRPSCGRPRLLASRTPPRRRARGKPPRPNRPRRPARQRRIGTTLRRASGRAAAGRLGYPTTPRHRTRPRWHPRCHPGTGSSSTRDLDPRPRRSRPAQRTARRAASAGAVPACPSLER